MTTGMVSLNSSHRGESFGPGLESVQLILAKSESSICDDNGFEPASLEVRPKHTTR